MKNPPLIAIIREAECIGCTKCIQACPVDAIIGAQWQMHTVLAQECTGCQLCVTPCPVDCIDMVATTLPNPEQRQQRAQVARRRVVARQQRIERNKKKKATDPTARQQEIAKILERAYKRLP